MHHDSVERVLRLPATGGTVAVAGLPDEQPSTLALLTRHAYTPFLVLYSKKLWDQLNPQEQAVLREAAMEGQKVQRAANRALNEKSLASLKTKGMQVNEVNSAEQNRIRAKVASVYDKHKDSIGADAIKVVQDELRKARGG